MPFLDLANYTTVLSLYNKLHIDNMTYATSWSYEDYGRVG